MNIAIIGAGSIGALKSDKYENRNSDNILTHAHAAYILKKKKLINDFFIIESNWKKRAEANKKWDCKVFKSLEELKIKQRNIDIFVIAVPTEIHYDILTQIINLRFNSKLVICEKPFCSTIQQAKWISKQYMSRDIPIVVDYIRRFSPTIQTLKDRLESNEFGKPQSCNIVYTRGLIRDGCHAIDLCNLFFGEFKRGKILGNKSNAYNDYSNEDLTYPVWMEYENCKNIFFTPVSGNNYSIFEMDILTEKARICLIDHSKTTKIFPSKPEKIYGDFNSITYESVEDINNELVNSLYFLHGNCIEYLNSKNKNKYDLFCTSVDAILVHEVYKKIL